MSRPMNFGKGIAFVGKVADRHFNADRNHPICVCKSTPYGRSSVTEQA